MNDTIAGAADYLMNVIREDGSWGDGDSFVCARAVAALDAAGGDEKAKAAGISYLENQQAEDGHFPGRSGMYSDAACTAYTLLVLNRFHYSKASLPASRGLLWLLENQRADGSWGGKNLVKTAYTTSLCLRALYVYNMDGIEKYRRALGLVLDRIADPGFFHEPVSHVYGPVLNLQRAGRLPGEARTAFISYAEDRLCSAFDGGQTADVAYLAGTLGALGDMETCDIGADWLSAARNADGGFGKDVSAASDPNWTALVVLALTNNL